jgi:hypothetical protein
LIQNHFLKKCFVINELQINDNKKKVPQFSTTKELFNNIPELKISGNFLNLKKKIFIQRENILDTNKRKANEEINIVASKIRKTNEVCLFERVLL